MGMADGLRTGRVSKINYEAGTYEVTYFDRGQSVTREINAVSNGEYKMPNIGDVVSVQHLANGAEAATSYGTVWNKTNKPAEGYKGLYRKEYGSKPGQSYSRYDENTGVFTQFVDGQAGRVSNGAIVDQAKGSATYQAGGNIEIHSTGASASIEAANGVGISAGTNVSAEAGGNMSFESKGEMSVVSEGKYSAEHTAGVTVEITGEATVKANGATIQISAGGDVRIASPTKISIDAPEVNITGGTGDVVINGISLVTHTHSGGGTGAPQ